MSAKKDDFRRWPEKLQIECLERALELIREDVPRAASIDKPGLSREIDRCVAQAWREFSRKASMAKRTDDDVALCFRCHQEITYRTEGTGPSRLIEKLNWPTGGLHACPRL